MSTSQPFLTASPPPAGLEDASFPDDILPPEAEYQSRKALVTAINTWAVIRGYAFITRKSTTKTSGRKIITYACNKSWMPKAPVGKEAKHKTMT